ncbi:MAG: hypothetical protein ACLQDQ_17185 [Myxococcaceae bacterium]
MTHRAGRAFFALAGLLLPALSSAATTAHHSHASLDVTKRAGAHSCPSDKELRRAVSSILGYWPFDANARRRVSAVLSTEGGTFHARIQLRDAHTHKSLGVRVLAAPGPTCEELGSAMALAIALAIDPLAQPPPSRVRSGPPVPPASSLATAPSVEAASPGAALAVGGSGAGAAVAGSVSSSPGASGTGARASGVRPPAPQTLARPEPPVAPPAPPDAGTETLVPRPPDAGTEALAATLPPVGPDAGARGPVAQAVAASDSAPDAGRPPSPTAAVREPEPPVAPAPAAPAVEAAAATAGPEARPFHGIVGAGAEWTVGLVPRRAFGVLLHGGVAFGLFSVELEAGWLPSTSFAFESGTISSTLVTGALVGCGTLGAFGLCALVQTGPLASSGQGYYSVNSPSSWVLAFGVRGQWDWVFAHPVGLRLQATGFVNAVQTHLQVQAEPTLTAWTSPTFALSLAAGLFVLF